MAIYRFEDGTQYQAQEYVEGIFINPVLPDDFFCSPLESRSEDEMTHWYKRPFIISDDDYYKGYCLDGRCEDKPTLLCGFDTLEKTIAFLTKTYRNHTTC